MKAIVLLFTATLFVVCSAFPTVGGQQSNELCKTLAYPQDAPAAYVHLCYTPGKGITRILNFVTISDFLLVCTCVYSQCARRASVTFFHEPHLQAAVCYQYCIYFCSFCSTTIAGTCILAYLPRCLPSNMQNETAMNVTLRSGQHVVLFSYEPCKNI